MAFLGKLTRKLRSGKSLLSMTDKKFIFWVQYLKTISLFFAMMGVLWAVVGSFDPFGIYDSYFANAFWQTNELPKDAQIATRFLLAPFGATSTGYFILQFFIAKYAFAERQLWAYHAILTAFFFWFILDSIMCLYYRAYFNILMANVPSLIAMLPVVFTRRYFVENE